jgi:alkanesulfonate monooxygenase SsuD/methylene tetrahydromethanopterin reductase-like flavin-dependent oxidoreductase (luciferase family)
MIIGLTDHLEGPLGRPSRLIYDEVAELVRLADQLGVRYAWFTEHHQHIHHGHMPTPLLFALHMAGQTTRIQLGTAIICLNLHHALDVAEQVAVADTLTHHRFAPGFGSGATPEEATLFGIREPSESERHTNFRASLSTITAAWTGGAFLPKPPPDLPGRCWIAVNSTGSAAIAGACNYNMLFSHLRTPEQYRSYVGAYKAAGGRRLIAANRPVYVGATDEQAFAEAEPALRTLWRRFQREGKIKPELREPSDPRELCAHPINFIVGGPQTVAAQFRALHEQCPFDVMNIEVRWADLPHDKMLAGLRRLMRDTLPLLQKDETCTRSA